MICPYCGGEEQKVLDSRDAKDGLAIRRRRECASCNRRFTTFEEPEKPRLFLVKRDGSREEFSREKVLRGAIVACRKRPVDHSRLLELAEGIERSLMDDGELEIPSAQIGRMVMERLLDVDEVAYVRFASVYEQFETPAEFSNIVDQIKKSRKPRILM
ncbi:MAG: transcriptional repressor NrdR [Fimbriimonadaceae bacterium]|nr:transcriptional repressor NrdR [Fimbriimonadaceae bacterium]